MIAMLLAIVPTLAVAQNTEFNAELYRMLSRDIFSTNGTLYLKPMVESVNATSNSRFFNSAYIPRQSAKPYFKVSLNGMLGLVSDKRKNYTPVFPTDTLTPAGLLRYGSFTLGGFNVRDTLGLTYYAIKTILSDGIRQGKIAFPKQAPTVLGGQGVKIILDHQILKELISANPAFSYLSKAFQDTVLSKVDAFPWYVTLPSGGNMSAIAAMVPQVEIGSLFGTELLVRCIPPVDLGKYIGKFSFWGLGLKHSISQYFPESSYRIDEQGFRQPAPIFDLCLQFVGQGSHLTNTVGETNAELTANAVMWDANIHASKSIPGILDVYTGLSYEKLYINSSYLFYIPIEIQHQISPDFKDTKPQSVNLEVDDDNFKFVIGAKRDFGRLTIYLDYNVSKFDIFTGGIQYRF